MYRNILVPVDLERPETWNDALTVASSLARCFAAKVTICTVVSTAKAVEHGEWLPISVEQLLFDAKARLEGFVAGSGKELRCDVQIGAGAIAGGVLAIAERIEADLILLVSHQPATRDYLVAANAIRIARRAPCSVLIARHND
jgi:nucleotide-binding universal stress UspA family protein